MKLIEARDFFLRKKEMEELLVRLFLIRRLELRLLVLGTRQLAVLLRLSATTY